MPLRLVSSYERAGAMLNEAEAWCLEECMPAPEGDSEVLHMSCAIVDELAAERALLTARTEQVRTQCDILAARICELEVDATICNGEYALWCRACFC